MVGYTTYTVTFIGYKRGLLTAQAKDYVGQLELVGLAVAELCDR